MYTPSPARHGRPGPQQGEVPDPERAEDAHSRQAAALECRRAPSRSVAAPRRERAKRRRARRASARARGSAFNSRCGARAGACGSSRAAPRRGAPRRSLPGSRIPARSRARSPQSGTQSPARPRRRTSRRPPPRRPRGRARAFRGVEDEPAARERHELAVCGRVPAPPVAAERLHLLALPAEQAVEERRLAHAGKAEQRHRPSAADVGRERVEPRAVERADGMHGNAERDGLDLGHSGRRLCAGRSC